MKCGNYTIQAIAKQCKDNSGGIKCIYITDIDNVTDVTVTSVTSGDTLLYEAITAITLSGSAKFAKWEFNAQTGTYTNTATISEENGTLYFQNDVALVFGKMDKVKRVQIMAATVGGTAVVVRDMNDNLFYLGLDNAVNASMAGGEAGQNMGDRSGYSITLSDFSKVLPYHLEMSAEALAAIGID